MSSSPDSLPLPPCRLSHHPSGVIATSFSSQNGRQLNQHHHRVVQSDQISSPSDVRLRYGSIISRATALQHLQHPQQHSAIPNERSTSGLKATEGHSIQTITTEPNLQTTRIVQDTHRNILADSNAIMANKFCITGPALIASNKIGVPNSPNFASYPPDIARHNNARPVVSSLSTRNNGEVFGCLDNLIHHWSLDHRAAWVQQTQQKRPKQTTVTATTRFSPSKVMPYINHLILILCETYTMSCPIAV